MNEGEVPQYYVENSHAAIINPDLFDQVQVEIARRQALGRRYSGKSIFSCRLVCGDCGGFLGPKVWNSTSKYRHVVWQCNDKFKGDHKCGTPHLTEAGIKAKFLEAYNQLLPERDWLIEDCQIMQEVLTDCTDLNRAIREQEQELSVVEEMVRRYVDDNSSKALDQEEYLTQYSKLEERCNGILERIKELKKQRIERMLKADAIGGFMFRLREMDQALEYFDDRLWQEVIDIVRVEQDGTLVFRFQNGVEVPV